MLRKHIVPALGERLVADVEYKDILAFHNSLHHMPTVANRAADILVKMFNLSDAWGWRPSGTNPARGVPRFRVEKHERFLTREELFRLGQALRAAPAERLASTGARAVPLSPAAIRVLTARPRRPGNPWVFPGRVRGTRLRTLNASWMVVRKAARLEDVRLHDLRHSFASRALALGESLPMIAKLLGHTQIQTTARYAHLARNSVEVAAVRIADSLEDDMDTPPDVSAAA